MDRSKYTPLMKEAENEQEKKEIRLGWIQTGLRILIIIILILVIIYCLISLIK